MFDVTMGSYDGAEICKSVGRFIFDSVAKRCGKENVRLCRDDGLVLLKNMTSKLINRARKDLRKIFEDVALEITAHTN